MDTLWQKALWKQFGAAIDMLGDALKACPDELWQAGMWNDPTVGYKFSEFWYVSYHALFWLDLYLSGSDEGFQPPAPFTLSELDAGALPDRRYSRGELLDYLAYCRQKGRNTIDQLTDESASRACYFLWIKDGIGFAELLLYNLRHVQEHGAQLHMFLGQQAGMGSRWVGRAKDEPGST